MVHDNVALIREAKGVRKTYVAKKLKMSPMNYGHIEAGNVSLSVERLKVIGEALETDPAIFLSDELTESVIQKLMSEKLGREPSMNPQDYPLSLRTVDVASIMGISVPKLYDFMRRPDFPAIRDGRKYIIPRDAFFKWFNETAIAAK